MSRLPEDFMGNVSSAKPGSGTGPGTGYDAGSSLRTDLGLDTGTGPMGPGAAANSGTDYTVDPNMGIKPDYTAGSSLETAQDFSDRPPSVGGLAPSPSAPGRPDDLFSTAGVHSRIEETVKERLRANLHRVSGTSPDRNAADQKLGMQAGYPPDLVARQRATIEAEMAKQGIIRATQRSPGIRNYLADQTNMAVSMDDAKTLAEIEGNAQKWTTLIKHVPRFMQRGKLSVFRAFSDLSGMLAGGADLAAEAIEDLTGMKSGGFFENVRDTLHRESGKLDKTLNFSQRYGLPEQFRGKDLVDHPELLKDPLYWAYSATDAFSSQIPQFITMAATRSPKAAGLVGGGMEAASLYREMVTKGAADNATSMKAALAYGLVSSQLNKISLDKMFGKGAAKTAGNALKRVFVSAGTEALTEYIESPVQALIKTFAEAGLDWDLISDEVGKSLKEGFNSVPGSLLVGGGVSTVSNISQMAHEKQAQADKARQIREVIEELDTLVNASTTRERMPEAFDRAVEAIMDIDPDRAVDLYVDPARFKETVERQGLALEDILGDPAQIEDFHTALDLGTDMALPLPDYIKKIAGTDMAAEIIPHVKLAPDEMTPLEAEDFDWDAFYREEMKDGLESARRQEAVETAQEKAAEDIAADITSRMAGAGRHPDEARHTGEYWADYITTMAERTGQDPVELYETMAPQVKSERWGLERERAEKARQEDSPSDFFRSDVNGDAFRAKLDDVASMGSNPKDVLEVGQTPIVLQAAGAGPLPMTISRKRLNAVLLENPSLPKEALAQLPEAMADPVMVFDSATVPGGLVVITEMEHNNDTVAVAVQLNRVRGRYELARIETVPPGNPDSRIQHRTGQGSLRYVNREKSRLWPVTEGLQLPRASGDANGFSDINILSEKDVVNRIIRSAAKDNSKGFDQMVAEGDTAGIRVSAGDRTRVDPLTGDIEVADTDLSPDMREFIFDQAKTVDTTWQDATVQGELPDGSRKAVAAGDAAAQIRQLKQKTERFLECIS